IEAVVEHQAREAAVGAHGVEASEVVCAQRCRAGSVGGGPQVQAALAERHALYGGIVAADQPALEAGGAAVLREALAPAELLAVRVDEAGVVAAAAIPATVAGRAQRQRAARGVRRSGVGHKSAAAARSVRAARPSI